MQLAARTVENVGHARAVESDSSERVRDVMQRSTLAPVSGHADWSHRGDYIVTKHDVTPDEADEAVDDPDRIVIDPDYNSTSGRSTRIMGFSPTAGDLLTVIVLVEGDATYGVSAWRSNARDRRIYLEREQ